MRDLAFGVEIEFTGMTRKRAAELCAAYFGTRNRQETLQNLVFPMKREESGGLCMIAALKQYRAETNIA